MPRIQSSNSLKEEEEMNQPSKDNVILLIEDSAEDLEIMARALTQRLLTNERVIYLQHFFMQPYSQKRRLSLN